MSHTRTALYDALSIDMSSLLDPVAYPEQSATQAALRSLSASFLKKWEDTSERADQAAIQKFLEIEDRNSKFVFDYNSLPTKLQLILGEARAALGAWLEGLSPQQGAGNCGPGSSAGIGQVSSYEKHWDGPLSATSLGAYRAYFHSLTPRQIDAERIRAALYPEVQVRRASSLVCVPKTQAISRTICVEPSVNMWLQKRMESTLTLALKRAGIDLVHQQQVNRHWARQGSRGCGLATIDLSSASDTILPDVVRWLFPSEWYSWLNAVRCKYTILPDGSEHEFALFTSMGNAATFPMQTLMFAALLEGVYRICGGRGPIAVNGDDIIVTEAQYSNMTAALEAIGCIPNHEKSFSSGPFRESCGGDYWNGHDVRGVYIRKIDNLAEAYSALNRVRDWCSLHNVVLYETLHCLVKLVRSFASKLGRGSKLSGVPYWESPISGFRDPCFKGVRYKSVVVVPRRINLTPFTRGLSEPGLILAFLRGDLTSTNGQCHITIRSDKVKLKRRTCTTFFHDGRACSKDEFLSLLIWGYAKGH